MQSQCADGAVMAGHAAGDLPATRGKRKWHACGLRVATNIVEFRLENRRLAALDGNSDLMVKEGDLFVRSMF